MDDNVALKIKEPPVLAYWNNPRGAVCHHDVVALYSVLEKLGDHDRGCTSSLNPVAARDRRRCAS